MTKWRVLSGIYMNSRVQAFLRLSVHCCCHMLWLRSVSFGHGWPASESPFQPGTQLLGSSYEVQESILCTMGQEETQKNTKKIPLTLAVASHVTLAVLPWHRMDPIIHTRQSGEKPLSVISLVPLNFQWTFLRARKGSSRRKNRS